MTKSKKLAASKRKHWKQACRVMIWTTLCVVPSLAYADPVTLVSTLVFAAQSAGYISALKAFAVVVTASVLGAVDARRKAKRAEANARAAYNSKLQDRSVTTLRALPPRRVVYGRCITGGDVVAIFTTDKTAINAKGNTYTKADALKHLVVVFAAHEVEAINEIYIDGEAVGTLQADGTPNTIADGKFHKRVNASRTVVFTSDSITVAEEVKEVLNAYARTGATIQPVTVTLSNGNKTITVTGGALGRSIWVDYRIENLQPSVRISKFLGSPTQPVDPYLNSIIPSKWTANHRLRGLAGIVITLDLEETRFQGGPPGITADISGKKLYDPRTGTTAWSDNPALCARDYLLNRYGYNLETEDVNDAYVIAAANACDELISLTVGGVTTPNQKRYTCNGSFTTDDPKETVLGDIVRSMGGFAIQSSQWLLTAGVWTPPVMDLTDNDLDGQIEIVQAGTGIDNLFNGVRATHIEAGKASPSELEPYQNPTFKAVDGEDLWEDLAFPYTDNRARGVNLSRIMVERNRQGQVIRYPAKMRGWELAVGERVRVTSDEYGFVLKHFRITDWQFGIQAPVLLTLQEDIPNVYDQVTATTADEAPNTELPEPNLVPAVAGVTLSSGTNELLRLQDGTIIPRVRVSWTAFGASAPYMNQSEARVQVRWRTSADDGFRVVNATGGDNQVFLEGVQDGQYIVLEVQAINSLGRSGPVGTFGHRVVGKTAPPSNVTGLSAQSVIGGMLVDWDPNTEADYLETELRHGVSWAAGTFIWVGSSSEWTWVPASNGTYTVWAVHRDTSGNESTPVSVTISYVVSAGANGANVATVMIYRRSLTTPALPSVDSTYTFSTGVVSGLNNGWSTSVPSGFEPIWMAARYVATTAASITITPAHWSGPVLQAASGVSGSLSKEAVTVTTANDGSGGDYSVASGVFSVFLGTQEVTGSGTSYTSGTVTGITGFTLNATTGAYAMSGLVTDVGTAVMYATYGGVTIQKTLTISKAKQGANGANGTNGTNGANGAPGSSARIAYTKITGAGPLGTTPTVLVVTGDNPPNATAWGGPTWTYSLPTYGTGESVWQSDGIFNPNENQTTWSVPYLSNFKVGNLSAITATTGNLTVNGNLQVSTGMINGGDFTGWAWPAAGTNGFHLGPNGLLLGNFNNGRYLQVTADGQIYAPGLTIENGNALFYGRLEVGSSPAQTGTTMTGSGAVFNPNGVFAIGNSSRNVSWNGTQLTINGDVVATGNLQADSVTASQSITPYSNFSIVPPNTATAYDTGNINLTTFSVMGGKTVEVTITLNCRATANNTAAAFFRFEPTALVDGVAQAYDGEIDIASFTPATNFRRASFQHTLKFQIPQPGVAALTPGSHTFQFKLVVSARNTSGDIVAWGATTPEVVLRARVIIREFKA